MRALTVVLAYYDNARMLARQLAFYDALPLDLRLRTEVIIVDDGSTRFPANIPRNLGIATRLYRMLEDIPWNQDACRNLGVSEAREGWILMTDMDHIPSLEVIEFAIRHPNLREDYAYTFGRVNFPDMDPYKPHPNSYLMTRAMYFAAEGYDERYRGIYGTDGAFAVRLREKAARIVERIEPLVRYSREQVPDASTTTLTRKSPENTRRRKELDNTIKKSKELAPVWGLTKWARIL